jgi:hypothetical protein
LMLFICGLITLRLPEQRSTAARAAA